QRQQRAEHGVVIEREAHDAEHREERGNALDGERLKTRVTVGVRGVQPTVVIEPGDRENQPEGENESTDAGAEQEQLLEPVVCRKPLDHGLSPPRRMFCSLYRLMGTIAPNSRI